MKQIIIFISLVLFTVLSLSAQYSTCYTDHMAQGDAAFKQGKYSTAKTYYVTAKLCAGGNPAEAQKKISACEAKIKAQQDAAEAKRKAEQEAAEAKRRAEEEELHKEERMMDALVEGFDDMDMTGFVQDEDETYVPYDVGTGGKEELPKPLRYVEEMPEFPGGQNAMLAYLQQEIVYPQVAISNGIQGTVLLEFVVEMDGSISNIKPLVSLYPACDEEAIRVVKAMPKWKPGKQMGKPARVYFNIPISFSLGYSKSKKKR